MHCQIVVEALIHSAIAIAHALRAGNNVVQTGTRSSPGLVAQTSANLTAGRSWCQCGFYDVLAVDLLQLNVLLAAPNGVDKGKLHQAAEDEEGAAQEPHLRHLYVAHLGQVLALR